MTSAALGLKVLAYQTSCNSKVSVETSESSAVPDSLPNSDSDECYGLANGTVRYLIPTVVFYEGSEEQLAAIINSGPDENEFRQIKNSLVEYNERLDTQIKIHHTDADGSVPDYDATFEVRATENNTTNIPNILS